PGIHAAFCKIWEVWPLAISAVRAGRRGAAERGFCPTLRKAECVFCLALFFSWALAARSDEGNRRETRLPPRDPQTSPPIFSSSTTVGLFQWNVPRRT